MADASNLELKIDTKAAQEFLDAIAMSARRPFAIVKPGDVVFVETDRQYPEDTFQRLKSAVGGAAANAGVKVVVLPYGMKVAQVTA